MKKAMQEAFGQFEGLWNKNQTRRKAAPARVQRAPDPSEELLRKYAGPAEWAGASVAWGPGRASPCAKELESRVPQYFSLGAEQILGVLGSGLGGSVSSIARSVRSFVHGYDWRASIESQASEFARSSHGAPKASIHTIMLDSVVPPLRRLHGLVAVEPVLTLSHEAMLDWMRMGLEPDARLVLEEPSLEPGHGNTPSHSWFTDVPNSECTWMGRGEREAALNHAGFWVIKVRETTGTTLRNMRFAIENAKQRGTELKQAMEIASILEDVFNSFTEQIELAKNRLHALENGEIAVYRYMAIKQRAET